MAGKARGVLKGIGLVVAVLVVAVAGFFFWAKSATGTRLAKTFTTHTVEFPIPFPLSEQEIEELRAEKKAVTPSPEGQDGVTGDVLAGVDLKAVALERAIARGKHLVQARYVCQECHGKDFGGGTMFNDPAVGAVFGPNLTGGQGSRVGQFTVADWDRIVRHGVRLDGTPAIMPSEDFAAMSDHELSDIIAFIRSQPKVDKQMPDRTFGPLITVLTALNKTRLSAEGIEHQKQHVAEPPLSSDPLAYGKHIAQACTGCHRADFTGGPVVGGPPDWAPAANLTQKGLGAYKFEDFEKLMRKGIKPDGSHVKLPMTLAVPATAQMKDEEVKALWTFFQTLPAKDSSN